MDTEINIINTQDSTENEYKFDINELFQSKYVNDFTETTPEGNKIKGKILLNHGSFHGSLLITEVNNTPTEQFIRGFPKIKYYSEDMQLSEYEKILAFEKLDGTCIGFYELKDEDGFVIEVVPKTRQRAVADEHFLEMLKLCPTYTITRKCCDIDRPSKDTNLITFYELFGMLNEHTVPHKQTYIDLRLIGASYGEHMLPYKTLKKFSQCYSINLPNIFATITLIQTLVGTSIKEGYNIKFNPNIFDMGIPHFVKTGQEMIDVIKHELDERNKLNKSLNGNIYYEGVVLQNPYDGYNHYIKVKPDTYFELAGKSELKVPINEIKKEVVKIINENITEYNENYNEKEVISFINENLAEEYTEDDIKNQKTQRVVKKELRKYIDSINDKGVNAIVDEILKEQSETTNISDLMRYFANKYPMMKHKSSDVHFILTKRLKKNQKS